MFLALAGSAPVGLQHIQPHDVGRRKEQNAERRPFRPADSQGMFHRRRQIVQELSEISSQRLRRDEREPQYRKIEEQAERDSARLRLGWLSQLSITLPYPLLSQ